VAQLEKDVEELADLISRLVDYLKDRDPVFAKLIVKMNGNGEQQ